MSEVLEVKEVSGEYRADDAELCPVGYKRTEVGVIPEDWKLADIQSISSFPMQNGLFYEPARKGKGKAIINVGDLYKSAPIDLDMLDLFDATEVEIKNFKVEFGDLFFTRSSIVPSGIAHCNIYQAVDEKRKTVFDSHLIRVRVNSIDNDPSYIYLACLSRLARKYLIGAAKTATMTTIDQGAIKKCPVLIPTKKEQTSIANAIFDIDALIKSLEKLIAKKQAIKTATMQQLLTGKKRLPGFGEGKGYKQTELGEIPEDWDVVELGGLVHFNNGKAHENDICEHGKYVVVNSKFISTESKVKKYTNVCHCPVSSHSVLMVMSDIPNGKAIAKCFYVEKENEYTVNQRICSLTAKKIWPRFLFYQLNRNKFYLQFDDGVKQTNLRRDDVLACPLMLPASTKEQESIASVIFDLVREIETLVKRLNKTKQIKQGMMQELLTGKTRLVHEGEINE